MTFKDRQVEKDFFLTHIKEEFPLWRSGIDGVSGVLGHRFHPRPAPWVKDPALLQPQVRSRVRLGSHPWPANLICLGAAKREKEKEVRGVWKFIGVKASSSSRLGRYGVTVLRPARRWLLSTSAVQGALLGAQIEDSAKGRGPDRPPGARSWEGSVEREAGEADRGCFIAQTTELTRREPWGLPGQFLALLAGPTFAFPPKILFHSFKKLPQFVGRA